ncbi:MAG: hypothetical protein ACREQB_04840 [Candidatus Binataceae bacterium]
MPLRDAQIERYSRQIVVPGFGGKAQDRLLRSELVVIGSYDYLAMTLRYFAGAGVGRISVATQYEAARERELLARIGALNPDVRIDVAPGAAAALVLALIDDNQSRDALAARKSAGAFVVARLDAPAMIAIIPARPPCPTCCDANLQKPVGHIVDESNFIAMLAATEALKIVAGVGGAQAAHVIEFGGYESRSRVLGVSKPGHCAAPPAARRNRIRGR